MRLQSQLFSHERLHEHLDLFLSGLSIGAPKELDESGIQARRDDANPMLLEPFIFNCTLRRGTLRRSRDCGPQPTSGIERILPVIVTSAHLFACHFCRADIDADTGEIPYQQGIAH
jgi:hypothetical protein